MRPLVPVGKGDMNLGLFARWQTDSGTYWTDLYCDEWGYSYSVRGSSLIPLAPHHDLTPIGALAWMDWHAANGAFHTGRHPMRRVI